jgi:hypothetical protein
MAGPRTDAGLERRARLGQVRRLLRGGTGRLTNARVLHRARMSQLRDL